MPYFILTLGSLFLFVSFLTLVSLERKRGMRVFARIRSVLDERMARAFFVVSHVDWSAFLGHMVRSGLERIGHDLAHGTLILVRALERTLTRVVGSFRRRNALRGASIPQTGQLLDIVKHFRKSLQQRRTLKEGEAKDTSTEIA